jgi:hypothetical protein
MLLTVLGADATVWSSWTALETAKALGITVPESLLPQPMR